MLLHKLPHRIGDVIWLQFVSKELLTHHHRLHELIALKNKTTNKPFRAKQKNKFGLDVLVLDTLTKTPKALDDLHNTVDV